MAANETSRVWALRGQRTIIPAGGLYQSICWSDCGTLADGAADGGLLVLPRHSIAHPPGSLGVMQPVVTVSV